MAFFCPTSADLRVLICETDGRMDGRTDKRTDDTTVGSMDRGMDGSRDGQRNEHLYLTGHGSFGPCGAAARKKDHVTKNFRDSRSKKGGKKCETTHIVGCTQNRDSREEIPESKMSR